MGIYQITAIKYNGKEVEGTVKVPDDGEITLQVETDTVSEDSKFYGLILGKYYEIILENSEIKLGEEKALSEIEDGVISSELTATLEKSTEATTDVDIEINQDEVTLKGKGDNTGRGTGIIKISYGTDTRSVGIDVVGTVTVTVQAEKDENNQDKGTIILPRVKTQKYASGSVINLQATANTGFQFKGWYDGTNVLSTENPYNDYQVSVNKTIIAKFEIKRKYGGKTNIGTLTVNGTSLNGGWNFFYEDEATNGKIYLMYGDYLPNELIPSTGNIQKSGLCVKSTTGDLLSFLNGSGSYAGVWNTLNEAVKVAIKARLIASGVLEENADEVSEKIATNGAPGVSRWINSFNQNYGTVLGWTLFVPQNVSETMTYYNHDTFTGELRLTAKTKTFGYLYTRDRTNNPIRYEMSIPYQVMQNLEGYPGQNEIGNMYYPHTSGITNSNITTYGYWLSDRLALPNAVCAIRCNGELTGNDWDYEGLGICPVVSIPKSETIDIKSALGID